MQSHVSLGQLGSDNPANKAPKNTCSIKVHHISQHAHHRLEIDGLLTHHLGGGGGMPNGVMLKQYQRQFSLHTAITCLNGLDT